MKKYLLWLTLALCGASLFAAPVSQASKAWVKREIAAAISAAGKATVVENADGSRTCSSPFTCDTVPDAVSISLTFSPVRVIRNGVVTVVPFSFADLFIRRAFAQAAENGEQPPDVVITITSGYYETKNLDNEGNPIQVPFNFGTGLELTLQDDELPKKPNERHTCDIDSTCYCKGYGKSQADFIAAAVKEYPTIGTEEFASAYGLFDSWINTDTWPDVTTNPRTKEKRYWVRDAKDERIAFDVLDGTEAWRFGLLDALKDINSWMEECQEAYCKSKVCDKENPQHNWEIFECGNVVWKKCRRNTSHVEGAEDHEMAIGKFDAVVHFCACGKEKEAHTLSGGERKMKSDGTGWTKTTICADGCGFSVTIDHTCKHVHCKPCSGGDGCDLPCPACKGAHDFSARPASGKCVRCACDGCALTQRSAGVEVSREKHIAWDNCHFLEAQNDNTRSEGVHCCCECGDYSHKNGTEHEREKIPEKYEPCTPADIIPGGGDYRDYHWVITASDCKFCGDKQGVLGEHQYETPENGPTHKKLSNEKCALNQECKLCKRGKVETEEEAGAHVKGIAVAHTAVVGAEGAICRGYYLCTQCLEEFTVDEEHERDITNKCLCKNGCGYQLKHAFAAADRCGNKYCACGERDLSTAEQHIDFTPLDAALHVCACGKKAPESHIFSAWIEIERTATEIVYKRFCQSDRWGGDGCGAESEPRTVPIDQPLTGCTEDNHVPLPDRCGCDCGYYSASTHVSDDDKFHKWAKGKCKCLCARKHKFLSGNDCPDVCAGWRECGGLTVDGEKAKESDHTPATSRCGCKCTAINHTAKTAVFHPQAPGSCRCYGANGDGRGAWHYPESRDGCTSICRYPIDGKYHLANMSDEPERILSLIAAKEEHHIPSVGLACGCVCGELSEANWEKWVDLKQFHKLAQTICGCACQHATPATLGKEYHRHLSGSCLCVCENEHLPKYAADHKCFNICRGGCGLLALPEIIKAKPEHHTPNKDECGCECGEVTSDTGLIQFHEATGSPECCCSCRKFHPRGEGRDDCYNVCRHCFGLNGNCYYADKPVLDILPESSHTFGNYCVCACPEKVDRAHLWPTTYEERETGETEICNVCTQTIKEVEFYRECKRDCAREGEKAKESLLIWKGHDMSKHLQAGDTPNESFCEKHKITYIDECPKCKESAEGGSSGEDGGSSGGGQTDGSGRENGGSGSIGDIWIIIA